MNGWKFEDGRWRLEVGVGRGQVELVERLKRLSDSIVAAEASLVSLDRLVRAIAEEVALL